MARKSTISKVLEKSFNVSCNKILKNQQITTAVRAFTMEEDPAELPMISSVQYRSWLDNANGTLESLNDYIDYLYNMCTQEDSLITVSMDEIINAIYRYRTDKIIEGEGDAITNLYLFTMQALEEYTISNAWIYTETWELVTLCHDFMRHTGEAPKISWALVIPEPYTAISIKADISCFYMDKSITINFSSFAEAMLSPVYAKLCQMSLPWWAAIPDITE
jgi:hypothetical protein